MLITLQIKTMRHIASKQYYFYTKNQRSTIFNNILKTFLLSRKSMRCQAFLWKKSPCVFDKKSHRFGNPWKIMTEFSFSGDLFPVLHRVEWILQSGLSLVALVTGILWNRQKNKCPPAYLQTWLFHSASYQLEWLMPHKKLKPWLWTFPHCHFAVNHVKIAEHLKVFWMARNERGPDINT